MTRGGAMRVALVLALVAALAIACARLVRVETDFSAFLPPSATPAQRLLASQLRDGLVARLMLVALEGDDEKGLARASRALAARLAGDPSFDYAANGAAGSFEAHADVLMRHRYALGPAMSAGRFEAPALRAALEEALSRMASPEGVLTRATLARDPTGEFASILAILASAASPERRQGVWFSADGRRAYLIAQTRAAGFDSEGQAAAMAKVRAALAADSPRVRATLSGPGVFAAESRRRIKDDALRLGLVSTGLVLLLLAFVYRSPSAVVLVLMPTALGLMTGVLVVHSLFGSVHAITLGFAATLVGESVDYPSYLLVNAKAGETARAASRRVGRTLLLAVLTTMASSLALTFSGFTGLAQLGVLTMTGVAVAGLASHQLVPWLLGDRVLAFTRLDVPPAPSLAKARWPRVVAIVAVTGSVAALVAWHPAWWEHDLGSLSPVPRELRLQDAELRREMGAPDVSVLLASGGDSEAQALEAAEAMLPALRAWAEAGLVRGFDSPARYLPPPATQLARLRALPDEATLSANLRLAQAGLPFRPDAFAPFVRDVAAARQSAPVTRADYAGTPLGTRLDAQVVQLEGRWLVLTSLSGVGDPGALRQALAALADARTQVVDLRQVSSEMLEQFRDAALRHSALGVVLIVVLLAVGLGSWRRAARVTVPALAAAPLTVACLAASGARIGVFHLVALLLVLGIGLNYALFFERPPADGEEGRRTRLALALCGASTVVTFGCLAFSATPVLRAIGSTVALGAVLSLGFALLWARPRLPPSDGSVRDRADPGPRPA